MSRRESLVVGEVVAEDAAEQAEKKRKQDEQRAQALQLIADSFDYITIFL